MLSLWSKKKGVGVTTVSEEERVDVCVRAAKAASAMEARQEMGLLNQAHIQTPCL